MRQKINNLVSVVFSFFRILILKIVHGNSFNAGFIQRISPNVVLEFVNGSNVSLGKRVRVHSGTKIKVRAGAKLKIGDNAKINYNCIIVCRDNISIGEGTEFGPSVYIYDHDHDFRLGLKNDRFKCEKVEIGNNCWIGANTIILRGTKIGNNCVVGAGCVIKGEYPDNSLIVQKRSTDTISY